MTLSGLGWFITWKSLIKDLVVKLSLCAVCEFTVRGLPALNYKLILGLAAQTALY